MDVVTDEDGWPSFDEPPARQPAAPPPVRAPERATDPHGFETSPLDAGGSSEDPTADIPPSVARAFESASELGPDSADAGDAPRRRRRRGRRGGRGRGRAEGAPPGDGRGSGETREPRESREPREPRAPREARGGGDRGRRPPEPADDGPPPAPEANLDWAEPWEDRRDPAPEPAPEEPAPEEPAPGRSESRGILQFFHPERLDACQRAIGYHFRDISFLENALTHSSIKSENRPSYERLEFLGDSVVGLIVSEYLYNLLPNCDEGELTKLKSIVVSTEGLATAAKAIGLDRFLAVGRGILMKEAVPRSLIADVFEGVVGAVYLDRGYESARLYVLDHLRPYVEEALSDRNPRNYKSVLQQVAQRELGETPRYDVLREWGPEHTRQFEVSAVLGRRRFPPASAPTKKEAEQSAARIALQTILVERGHGSARGRRRSQAGSRRR